ncbi:hypothetical protein MOB26_02120 [Bacillus vallismortis]|nr:hypothetical protein [Bacillus vallismortis]MCY7916348.1 hypothetical protein [Bacillus vallismortis]
MKKRHLFLPYSLTFIGKEENQEVTEMLESRWLSIGKSFKFLSLPLSGEGAQDVLETARDIVKGAD